MRNEELFKELINISKKNIFPLAGHLDIALKKGKMLTDKYNANWDIVRFGILLMDIKLGEAYESHCLPEHVKMGSMFAKEFLKRTDFNDEEIKKIINCIEAHHGKVPFTCIEAEICANTDCYRFIHPFGVFTYAQFLANNSNDLLKNIKELKFKLDEKKNILSLDSVNEELNVYYDSFSKQFDEIIEYMQRDK